MPSGTPRRSPRSSQSSRPIRDELGEEATQALACYGEDIFDTLLELVADPALRGYRRRNLTTAARRAAGDNPVLRARLADVLRPLLRDAIAQAMQPAGDRSAAESLDDNFELSFLEELSYIASELAGIADPLARDLIKTAFPKS